MGKWNTLARVYFERRKDKSRFDYNRDIEVPAMLKLIGNVKGKVILDIGCGFGDHIRKLSKRGAKRIVGFDASSKLIKIAKKQKIPFSEFYVGDMNKKLKFENGSFDIVFSSLALHYVKNLNRLFSEIHRVLKKGGVFVFSTGHPIFDLINQSPIHMVGIKKVKGKRIIYGNYFDESLKETDLGSCLGKMKVRCYTYETLIKTALKNNFELIDYIDAKPTSHSRRYNAEKYKLTTRFPTFILFKLRKK